MDKCNKCGEEVLLPFSCSYCQNYFCITHRLPESHNCTRLPARSFLGGSQTRPEFTLANAEQKQQFSRISATKRDLPIFRFNKNSRKKTKLSYPKRRKK